MRVYISGPMTGHPDHNAPAFFEAKKRLREQGHFVINPYELSGMFGKVDEIAYSFKILYGIEGKSNYVLEEDFKKQAQLAQSIMDTDLAAVRTCDAIYLLRGWENSRGARKELAEALKRNLEIILEGGVECGSKD